MHVERVAGVEELGAHAVGSSESARAIHAFHQRRRDGLTCLVVAGERR